MTFVPKRKQLLTIPVLKFVQDQPRFVKITDAMHLGKEQPAKDGEKAKEPATLCNCVNLEDGAECQIILSAVVKSVLTDSFPDGSYVGKCFAITKRGRNPGKQYNQFDIEEIEDPSAGEGETTATEATRPAQRRARG
jgi:hypothetical protein